MKRLLSTRRRKVATTFAVCAVAGITGAVFAAWTTTSDGDSFGQNGGLIALTIQAGGGSTDGTYAKFYPNQLGDVAVRVTNPAPQGAMKLVRVDPPTVGGPGTTDDPVGCPISNYTVDPTVLASPVAIPAGATALNVKIPGAVRLSAAAPSACQNIGTKPRLKLTFEPGP